MTKITTTGQLGIDLIKTFEGFYSKPYLCPAKVPTIGYGSTYYTSGKKVTLNDAPISEPEAVRLLKELLVSYEKSVDAFCIDTITQNQFDALASFAYNCGVGNLKSSTLLKKVNINPNDPTIKAEFLKWVKGGGKTLPGLVKRRTAEAELYFKK